LSCFGERHCFLEEALLICHTRRFLYYWVGNRSGNLLRNKLNLRF
jgi:hypothetical protein